MNGFGDAAAICAGLWKVQKDGRFAHRVASDSALHLPSNALGPEHGLHFPPLRCTSADDFTHDMARINDDFTHDMARINDIYSKDCDTR